MKIFIGTDHRGIITEKEITKHLQNKKYEEIKSNIEHSDTDDYVDFALDIAKKVIETKDSFGILICGTGIGMSIAANKVKGIRAARCVNKEDALLTRTDNDSNILCLSYKTPLKDNIEIIETFLNTSASSEERHKRRINKITKYENGEI